MMLTRYISVRNLDLVLWDIVKFDLSEVRHIDIALVYSDEERDSCTCGIHASMPHILAISESFMNVFALSV